MMEKTENIGEDQPLKIIESPKRRLLKYSIRLGCLVTLIIFFVLILLGIFQIRISLSPIKVTDAIMTTDLDADGNPVSAKTRFTPDEERILCVVTVSSAEPVNVGMRWFYEDELIYDNRGTISERGVSGIQPRPGQTFREGNYRVEIYLVKAAVKTVYFSVGW